MRSVLFALQDTDETDDTEDTDDVDDISIISGRVLLAGLDLDCFLLFLVFTLVRRCGASFAHPVQSLFPSFAHCLQRTNVRPKFSE